LLVGRASDFTGFMILKDQESNFYSVLPERQHAAFLAVMFFFIYPNLNSTFDSLTELKTVVGRKATKK